MENDELLFSRYLNGDEEGLAVLIERYGNKLTFYLTGIVHDVYEAEALMIEAFARIAEKAPRFKENCFRQYLYKTGRNLALRKIASPFRRYEFSVGELSEEFQSEFMVEGELSKDERDRILHLCMERIEPSYREALYLIYFEGLSHAEAGTVMNKNEKQIANLIFRGKKALRPLLEKEGITHA